MIPGTGPGRGVPWWRWHGNRVLVLRWAPADSSVPGIGIYRPEPVAGRREGRTIAVIGR